MKKRYSLLIGVIIIVPLYILSLNDFSFNKKSMIVPCSEVKKAEIVEVYVPKSNFVKKKALQIETINGRLLLKNNKEEIIDKSMDIITNCNESVVIIYKRKSKNLLEDYENVFFDRIEYSSRN